MARGDIVRAVPSNPQHSQRLACAYILHLALPGACWRRSSSVAVRESRARRGKHSKLWFQHCCIASVGIAVEQLAMSSDFQSKWRAVDLAKCGKQHSPSH
eukprot:134055-Amphidinium_carterae.1